MATRISPSQNKTYYINPAYLTFVENSGYGVNYIQVSASSSCYITVYDPDNGIRYNVESGYRKWKITAYNNRFPDDKPEHLEPWNIYVRLERNGSSALVVYDQKERAISGGIITVDEEGKNTVGEADPDYYYIHIGSVGETDGVSVIRQISYDTGYLDTPESKNSAWDILDAMFTPHYDDPNNPGKLSWIEAKSNMGIQGGVTMFIEGDDMDLPSIYDGIPLDNDSIYWEETKDENGNVTGKVLKAKGEDFAGTLGSLTNVGEWADNAATEDRIMVQEKDSTSWKALPLSEVSASFENVLENGDGNAYTSIELSEDKKKLTLQKGETFAKQSDYETLNTKVTDFLEGAEDTDDIINKWKELETFLSGMKETDELATILSEKADKATTLEGYGITDAYTKDEVDLELEDYVTLAGDQTIAGVKDFTGGLKVNGSPIVYEKDKNSWKLEGNLLVTGGVTAFVDEDTYIPSSIIDAIPLDGDTVYWEEVKDDAGNVTGKVLKAKGTGGVSTWDDLEGIPSWIGESKPSYTTKEVTEDTNLYFTNERAVAALEDSLNGYQTKITSENKLSYTLVSGTPTSLKNPKSLTFGNKSYDGSEAKTITAADVLSQLLTVDGTGSGLDADTLDGYHASKMYVAGRDVINIKDIDTYAARNTGSVQVNHTDDSGNINHADVLYTFKGNGSYVGIELHQTYSSSGPGYKIRSITDASKYTGWRTLAFEDSNVASATKLKNTRTIWGQSFNGTANVSGALSGATTGSFSGQVSMGSASIGGVVLFKSQDGVLYLDGDLVVSGGVTAYGDTSVTSDTIMDALVLDPDTLKIDDNGKLTVVGGTGGVSDVYSLTVKNSAGVSVLSYNPADAAASLTLTKSMVGLGNVENTSLSTWQGSSNVKTLGTVTSGTWNGSKIANSYLANSAVTIAGTSVSLGGSITAATLQSGLGLGSAAYKDASGTWDISVSGNAATATSSTKFAGYTMRNGHSHADASVDAVIQYTINATGLSTSYFYPIFFKESGKTLYVDIYSQTGIASVDYNQNRLEFTLRGQGWSDPPKSLTVHNYNCYDGSEKTIGCIAMGTTTGGKAVWVRGGLYYYVRSNYTPSLKSSAYTIVYSSDTSKNEVYSVGENLYGGTNTNVDVMWTPQSTSALGAMYHSGSIVLAEGVVGAGFRFNSSYGKVLSSVGWYRFAFSNTANNNGGTYIFHIRRTFSNSNNESYIVAATMDYSGINFTQLAGHYNTQLITQLRCTYTGNGAMYFDFYYNSSVENVVYVNATGDCSLQSPKLATFTLDSTQGFYLGDGYRSCVKTAYALTLWRGVSNGGCYIRFGANNQTAYSWVVGSNTSHQYSWWYKNTNAGTDTQMMYLDSGGNLSTTGYMSMSSAKVNGGNLTYNSTSGYWKLEGDLLVTGGVSAFSSDTEFTPSTITDAVNIDGVTIKRNAAGALYFAGSIDGGVASSVAWSDVTGKPGTLAGYGITDAKISSGVITLGGNTITPLTQVLGDSRYVRLSNTETVNVTSTQTGVVNFKSTGVQTGIRLYNGDNNKGGLWWNNSRGLYLYNGTTGDCLGLKDDGTPIYEDGGSFYTLLHTGNSAQVRIATFTTGATAGWYRIAATTVNVGNNIGTFYIKAEASGYHTNVILNAGVSYGISGMKPAIDQLACTSFQTSLTQARLVYHPTAYSNQQAFLDVYLKTAVATTISIRCVGLGWGTLYKTGTTGSVPSTHKTKAITFSDGDIVSKGMVLDGTLTVKRDASVIQYCSQDGETWGWLGFRAADIPVAFMNDSETTRDLLHSGNYNSYSPTLAGGGASGTWNIDVSGNASSATKLATARTLWGQSFNGASNISGSLTGVTTVTMSDWLQIGNGKGIKIANTSGSYKNVLSVDTSNNLFIGYDTSTASYNTYVDGYNLYLRTGSSHATKMTVASTGYVGIGTTTPDAFLDIVSSTANKDTFVAAKRSDTGYQVAFGVGSGGINRGIWDYKLDKWLLYSDSEKTNLTSNTWITQSSWNDGLALNRSVAGGGGSIRVFSSGTWIGIFGVNGSKQFEFDVVNSGVSTPVMLVSDDSSMSFQKGTGGRYTIFKPKQGALCFYQTTGTDGWSMGSSYYTNSGSVTGGINAYGSGDTLSYYYFGKAYNNHIFRVDTSGNVLAYGGVTMYSDIRKKKKLRDVELSLRQVADAPLIEHYYNGDDKKTTHVGSVAQYWAGMNDWFCKPDQEGFYTMEVQNAALASVISVARELVKYESSTDREIRLLKDEVNRLKDEIKILKKV